MTPEDKEKIKNELIDEVKESSAALKESVATLKSELRDEINRAAIKKEIIDQVITKRPQGDQMLKHPASLLVIGFVLTTVFGSIMTSCWKNWEKANEQSYLATQTRYERERLTRSEEIKQKYDVKDEIIRKVAETNTAAEEILLYFQMEPDRRRKEQKERIAYWKEASRNWRTSEKILKQRLLFRFTDPNVSKLFEEIGQYRNFVGVNINNQQEALSSGQPICRPIVDQAYLCMGHITGVLMPQVMKRMNEEILSDERFLRAAASASPNNTNSPGASPPAAVHEFENKGAELNACKELQKKAKICDPKEKSN